MTFADINKVTWYSKLLALILLVLLPFAGFLLGMKYQTSITVPSVQFVTNDSTSNSNIVSNISPSKLKITTQLKNGVLKYSGSVELPNPCYQVKDEIVILESYPQQVQVRISVVNPRNGTGGTCIQVLTTKEFSGELKISNQAKISVWFNGKPLK